MHIKTWTIKQLKSKYHTKQYLITFITSYYFREYQLVISYHLTFNFQAQLKLAEHLRKMAEEGKDVEGMEVDMDTLRKNMKRYGMDLKDLDWLDAERRRKVKAVTIFFYETSLWERKISHSFMIISFYNLKPTQYYRKIDRNMNI